MAVGRCLMKCHEFKWPSPAAASRYELQGWWGQTDRQTDRQVGDRLMDRLVNRQIDRQTDR